MTESLVVNEPAIRIGCFLGVFVAIALWEVIRPRRQRTVSRWARWPSNLAIKFKKKLGAKPLELWLYVDLWKRWRFYKLLKQYKDSGLGGFKLPDRDG